MRRVWMVCALFLAAGGTAIWVSTSLARSIPVVGGEFARAGAQPREAGMGGGRVLGSVAAGGRVLFGDRRIESGIDAISPGVAEAFPFKSTVSGTATSLGVYVDMHNRARTMVVGLYSDRGSRPGSRLAQQSFLRLQSGGWNKLQIRPTRIRSGRTYWLVVLATRGELYFRAGRSCQGETSDQNDLRSLSTAWRAGVRRNECPISAYAAGKTAPLTGTTFAVNNPAAPTPTPTPTTLTTTTTTVTTTTLTLPR